MNTQSNFIGDQRTIQLTKDFEMDTIKLTDRQQEVLNLVKAAIENTGAPPTRAEIATELGFKSANAAEEHLQALARKGVIELVSGTSRGIRLKHALKSDTLRSLNRHSAIKPQPRFSMPLPGMAQLMLPLVGRVAAGTPILAAEHIEQTYAVEASMFKARPDFLLKVRGLSMRDIGIMDGDLLAVQKATDAKNGQIVVARIGEEVTVKRYKRTASGIELSPENPDFKTIVVPADSQDFADFAIEGLAVGLIRSSFLM